MPKQRVCGVCARDQDGKQTRTVHTPGGTTQVGKQTLDTTPNGNNKAWLFKLPDIARRKDDLQSIRDSRKKAKRANKSEEAPRESVRDLVGPERHKAQKKISQQLLRAELSVVDRVSLNAKKNDWQTNRRVGQSVDVRDALNARRRANEKVTISVRLHCALCTQLCNDAFIFWWPSQYEKAAACEQTGNLPRAQTFYHGGR